MKKTLLTIMFLALTVNAFALSIVKLGPEYFPVNDSSRALANGYIYVGEPDLDPETPANQKTLSIQQEDGVIVSVSQPIRTSSGGVPIYEGSPVTLLVDGNYSLLVQNSYGDQEYYVPSLDGGPVAYGLSDYGCNLGTMVSNVGSTIDTHIIIDCAPDELSENITIPDNITIEWRAGFPIGGAFTLTVEGDLIAGDYKVVEPSTTTLELSKSIVRNPYWWGAISDDSTENITAFQAWANSFDSYCKGIIPPGTYKITGDIGFDQKTGIEISAWGANLKQYGTNNVTISANAAALADESTVVSHWYWNGGTFTNNTDYAANTNTGICTRGIVYAAIRGVRGIGFGNTFIRIGVRDNLWVSECSGFRNDIHLLLDDWVTVAGNPQIIKIENCGFSVHGSYGVRVTGSLNDVSVRGCSFIGSDAIVVYTGSPDIAGNTFTIDDCSFEQGTAGSYYIRTDYQNSKLLNNLSITGCNFQNTLVKSVQIEGVNRLYFYGNEIVTAEDGCLDIDVNSTNITIGSNLWVSRNSFVQAISYACGRSEIRFLESPIIIGNQFLSGWSGATLNSGTGTIDMSSVIGSFWNEAGKILPPSAWILNVKISDSGSESSPAALYFTLRDSTSSLLPDAATINIRGVPDSDSRNGGFIVPCDENGDIFYENTATGAGSMVVRITLVGYIR